jgi:hypothetical protein
MMQFLEIRVEGHLDKTWADWLDGFSITHTEQGETILTGDITDQAQLYGMLSKLRDLGIKLVSLNLSQNQSG